MTLTVTNEGVGEKNPKEKQTESKEKKRENSEEVT